MFTTTAIIHPIIPTFTGTITTHGAGAPAFIWDTTGGTQAGDIHITTGAIPIGIIPITDMAGVLRTATGADITTDITMVTGVATGMATMTDQAIISTVTTTTPITTDTAGQT